MSVGKATNYVRDHFSDRKHNEGSRVLHNKKEAIATVDVSRRIVADAP